MEHKHVTIFPHNIQDYQSLLTNRAIRAIGVFHVFVKSMLLGILSLATRWQPLNNKYLSVLYNPKLFWEEILCNSSYVSETSIQNKIYKVLKNKAYVCLADLLIKIEV